MMKKLLTSLAVALAFITLQAAPKVIFETSFRPGQWQMSDWEMVKSWRWPYCGTWEQNKDGISNRVPADATPQELQSKRCGETYTAMLLKQKFQGQFIVSSAMKFDYRMAPGLLIAAEPIKNAQGKLELREHFEIILYDDGLNVWHHFFKNGKQTWIKKHFMLNKKCYAPNKFYPLIVKIRKTYRGPQLSLIYNGVELGYFEPQMIKGQFRLGIVASEGRNHFQNFKVTTIR